jgi:hypothetical protein
MKQFELVFSACIFLLFSCTNSQNEEILTFIPGTYSRETVGEFGKSYDTLVITLQNKSANQFKIIRRWRYNRVMDGKVIEPEYKITETSGVFNPAAKSLQEKETLESFTFDIKKKMLYEGANQFTKIK